jgi:branched-subunit amino acid permease
VVLLREFRFFFSYADSVQLINTITYRSFGGSVLLSSVAEVSCRVVCTGLVVFVSVFATESLQLSHTAVTRHSREEALNIAAQRAVLISS